MAFREAVVYRGTLAPRDSRERREWLVFLVPPALMGTMGRRARGGLREARELLEPQVSRG